MLQRIQSIYLLLAALVSAVLPFVLKLWVSVDGYVVYAHDLLKYDSVTVSSIPVLFYASAFVSFITIFKYKNRQSQFVLGRVNILINLFILGLLVYHLQSLSGEVFASEKGIGAALPLIAIVLLVMANRTIKKDEDLVKSVDRLR